MIRPTWFNLTLRSVVTLFWALAAATTNAQPQPCEGWVPIPGHPNPYHGGTVYAATAFDPDGAGPLPEQLIVGGEALRMQGTTGGNVYRWDGHRWHEMGQGFDRSVLSLAVYEGRLYAGGDFSNSGGTAMPALARWAGPGVGDHWEPVEAPGGSVFTRATGGNPTVRAMTLHQGRLIVVGGFSQVGNLPAGNIAAWDSTTFSTFGTGLGGYVRAATVHQGELVVGGDFTTAGGLPARRLAKWNNSAWVTVGSSASDQGVDLAVRALVSHEGSLYIGGDFSRAGTNFPASGIVSIRGERWSALGTGVGGFVRALHADARGLFVGGTFTSLGGIAARGLGAWDGTSWSATVGGVSLDVQSSVGSLGTFNERLVVGGTFVQVGGFAASAVASFGNHGWSVYAEGLAGGPISASVSFRGGTYILGTFKNDGDTPLNGFARWDGRKWEPVPGWGDFAIPTSMFVADDLLWVQGLFAGIGPDGSPATAYAAVFDGSTWRFGFGGPDGIPNQSVVWNHRLHLYTQTDSGAWDGTSWSPAVPRLEAQYARMIALDGSLYGYSNQHPSTSAFYRYADSEWQFVSDLPLGFVSDVKSYNDKLYFVGGWGLGAFTIWDGSSWQGEGGGDRSDGLVVASGCLYTSTTSYYVPTLYQNVGLCERDAPRVLPPCPLLRNEGRVRGDFHGLLMNTGTISSSTDRRTDGTALFVSGPPTIIGQPIAPAACPHEPLRLDLAAVGIGMTYQWRRDGVPIPGATESVYEVLVAGLPAAGVYDCVLTNACGEVISDPVRYAPCLADHDCSNFIDFFDYADFVTDFEAGSPRADTNRDGFVDVFDYETFVSAFEGGC